MGMRPHIARTRSTLIYALATGVAALAVGACSRPASAGSGAPAGQAVHRTATVAAPVRISYQLTGVTFTSPEHGYGEFVNYGNKLCRIAVGATADGGARFSAPVLVNTWRCARTQPAGALVFNSLGDGFLYGPKLFVTHDGGRTWKASPQRGEVLAVAPSGRSVWLLEARCHPATGPGRCTLHLLRSANAGRTWAASPGQPSAATSGYGGQPPLGLGQEWLVRTSRSSGYVASLAQDPVLPGHKPVAASLWFTANGGRSWSRRSTPCTAGWGAAVSAAPDGTLFAICAGEPGAGLQGKTVERSTDGGRHWTTGESCGIGACRDPLGDGYLGTIDAVNASTVYLVGGRSPLLVTHDGGRNWSIVKAVTAGGDAGTREVIFFSRADGLVLGTDNVLGRYSEKPAIWRTRDGGRRWTVVHPVVG